MQAAVTLCVINHDGADRLAPALSAALAQSGGFAEVLFVDNASTDGSVDVVRARVPGARILRLPRNAGPGAARNAGLAAAANDLILFQDNDVRLEPGCLEALLSALRARPGALLVAPRVLYEGAPGTIQYDSADCHFLGLMAPRHADLPEKDVPAAAARTSSVVTACFLIDRARWRHGAPFDEDFVFNLEDHEFGLRANIWGYETWSEPAARVLHGGGTPELSYRPGYAVSKARVYYLLRNRWLIIARCYSRRTLLLLSPALGLYELFQLAGLARMGWLAPWWRALKSAAGEWPRLRTRRAEVRASRRVRDGELLRGGPLPLTGAVKGSRFQRACLSLLSGSVNGYWSLVRRFL
ncbi:MAG TPA: glycosyltransferase [Steroidobacteraceae bacterium]|jgi:GT2 family glycosyltransferase|nr:glycosyltransferase [Steroidobacteraceae bacterium]